MANNARPPAGTGAPAREKWLHCAEQEPPLETLQKGYAMLLPEKGHGLGAIIGKGGDQIMIIETNRAHLGMLSKVSGSMTGDGRTRPISSKYQLITIVSHAFTQVSEPHQLFTSRSAQRAFVSGKIVIEEFLIFFIHEISLLPWVICQHRSCQSLQ